MSAAAAVMVAALTVDRLSLRGEKTPVGETTASGSDMVAADRSWQPVPVSSDVPDGVIRGGRRWSGYAGVVANGGCGSLNMGKCRTLRVARLAFATRTSGGLTRHGSVFRTPQRTGPGGAQPAWWCLLRRSVVVGGGIAGVLWAVQEDGERGLVGAGQQSQRGFQAELVSDLESDRPAGTTRPSG